jgi:hypothetical protein
MTESVQLNGFGETLWHSSECPNGSPELTLARTQEDLKAAFHLLYDSYVQAGIAEPNPGHVRVTPFHLLPTTEVVVGKLRDEVISTVTITGDAEFGLPMESMYGPEIRSLRRAGYRLAEVGCFADRRTSPVRFLEMFVKLSSIAIHIAVARGYDGIVAATHPRHARFYERWFGLTRFGSLTQCPYACGNPAVALYLDVQKPLALPKPHPSWASKLGEQELRPTTWSAETLQTLRALLSQSDSLKVSETLPSRPTITPLADNVRQPLEVFGSSSALAIRGPSAENTAFCA